MELDTNTQKLLKVAGEPMRQLLAIIISKRTGEKLEDVKAEINNFVRPVPRIPVE